MSTLVHKREKFLAPKEVASALDMHISAVYRAIRVGDLPYVLLTERGAIRIPRNAIEPEPRP